jgi:N-acetylmuramoyl-L-alanine amidase
MLAYRTVLGALTPVLVCFSMLLGSSTGLASSLAGKTICVDPGHGGTAATDSYRVGLGGEREEWINLRVALELKQLLEAKGARVLMTRTTDVDVPLATRAKLALDEKADLFLSLHHNATADRSANFPILYYHGHASENAGSVALGQCLARRLRKALFTSKTPVSLCSDYVLFPNAGCAVLRQSYGIPGILGEASFFTNAEEEKRLKQPAYNRKEAKAYCQAVEDFFALKPTPPVQPVDPQKLLPIFKGLAEAQRMDPQAQRWQADYTQGLSLLQLRGLASPSANEEWLQKAFELFTRSARSLPESPVARDCHLKRAQILDQLGKPTEAAAERRRAEEWYVLVER